MTPLIRAIRSELRAMIRKDWPSYTVPGLWVGSAEPVTFPSAPAYLLHQFDVVDVEQRRRRGRTWTLDTALAYNASVRHVTSYFHGERVAESGWRTTGTFLKLAALLPYLVRMDVNTIILLPITEIGRIGRKGTLGSPYAVKHPWHLDPMLAEPCVGMSAEDQARVFVEMCHAVGIKVVIETVLRTASVDSSLVKSNPEWFYWIDEARTQELFHGFRPPHFTSEQLADAKEKVASGKFLDLPEPSEHYISLFTPPPLRVEVDEHGYKGIGPKNRILRIPSAFADWPPDDEQPPWTDVTYLRLHDHPQFRYMAYNTVRMYDRRLDVDEYRMHPLWNTIAAIIPYFIRTLNIDGVLIDMGHALPRDLRRKVIREARSQKPDLLVFEENFNVTELSLHDGYDGAVGGLPLEITSVSAIRTLVERIATQSFAVPVFATPESHNTPRAAVRWSCPEAVAAVWTILRLLPQTIGFIHAGIELDENTPVNTGLGFTEKEQLQFPPERLPLFSDVPLGWQQQSPVFSAIVRTARFLHKSWFWDHVTRNDQLIPINSPDPFVAFLRIPPQSRQGLLCIANLGSSSGRIRITVPENSGIMFLAPNAHVTMVGGKITAELEPYQVELVFTLH